MSERVVPETSVPPGENPVAVCPFCKRPFRAERQCTLHVGEVHLESNSGRSDYEAAVEAEAEELFVFHLKVFFALGAVYAAFIILAIIAFSLAG
ncbi:DUF7410 domain-containing protein [Haloprofundus salilacus]|uniref:DUF7410 domain-containing protein n=1 Tax=Haloprofundus salilacus TaxID=2876190 RepID=UPI001CCFDA38|nr:hypothetical protein [Haloprofundus salilacus]